MPFEFAGFIVPFGARRHVLVYGPEARAFGVPRFGPPVCLRPGYHFVARPDYLLPSRVVDDIGQVFEPPECYELVEARGDLFPRADVVGVLPTGQRETVFMKELDLTELAVFAAPAPDSPAWVRVDLAIDARPVPDNLALAPTPAPLELLARALPAYRLAPGIFGALGAAVIQQLLLTGRTDWHLTFDELDELIAE